MEVRTGASAARARKDGGDTVVELDGGQQVRCDVVIVGTGRKPASAPSASSSASTARCP